jgi:hypothetical protein
MCGVLLPGLRRHSDGVDDRVTAGSTAVVGVLDCGLPRIVREYIFVES